MYAVILEWIFFKNRLIIDSSFKVHTVFSRSSNLCRRILGSVTAYKMPVRVLQMCYQLEDLTGGAGDALQSVVAIKVYKDNGVISPFCLCVRLCGIVNNRPYVLHLQPSYSFFFAKDYSSAHEMRLGQYQNLM